MEQEIVIVSGLQRSGTSLVMQMLENAGLTIIKDPNDVKDISNPNGYYSSEKIVSYLIQKESNPTKEFCSDLAGKCIKIHAAKLLRLPNIPLKIKLIFIERSYNEIWESLLKSKNLDAEFIFFSIRQKEQFIQIVEQVGKWSKLNKVETLYLRHDQLLLKALTEVRKINEFFSFQLDEKLLLGPIDQKLYRSKATKNFLVTDRSPNELAAYINKLVHNKIYCEIGIGEGHLLNLVKGTKRKFGIEKTSYGVKRCLTLYPNLKLYHNDFFKISKQVTFDICFLWITMPVAGKIVNEVLAQDENRTVIMGINYFYHLHHSDNKRRAYIDAYPSSIDAKNWNEMINLFLKSLELKGFTCKINQIRSASNEIFSVALIQKS